MTSALLCIDFINEMMDPHGKLAAKGYPAFASTHETLSHITQLQALFRNESLPVIHVRIGFDASYVDQPKNSPLFGKAHLFKALTHHSWGTEFLPATAPQQDEIIIEKPRVNAFFGTSLAPTLSALGTKRLFICGVATDMTVSSTAREAHDRDFETYIVKDACVAANDFDHEAALQSLSKLASICQTENIPSLLTVK